MIRVILIHDYGTPFERFTIQPQKFTLQVNARLWIQTVHENIFETERVVIANELK